MCNRNHKSRCKCTSWSSQGTLSYTSKKEAHPKETQRHIFDISLFKLKQHRWCVLCVRACCFVQSFWTSSRSFCFPEWLSLHRSSQSSSSTALVPQRGSETETTWANLQIYQVWIVLKFGIKKDYAGRIAVDSMEAAAATTGGTGGSTFKLLGAFLKSSLVWI